MFVKKLVEKASRKQTGGGGIRGLKAEDVNPRLAFHYGIPAGSSSMAYDPIQCTLAISTKDGRIKLFGKDNTQALLQSEEAIPSKFLQFIENQGILLNVNSCNHIEVWDIDRKQLCDVHFFNEEITSFTVLQQSYYMYVGDCLGNISVLKLVQGQRHLINMQYRIPFAESHSTVNDVGDDTAIICILLQPMAENKRALIIFRDGFMSLWGVQESKIVFSTGGNTQYSSHNEPRKVVSACWACPFGSKVVVGYANGEIVVWPIPVISDQKNVSMMNKQELHAAPNIPLLKVNLGYKMDKIPIVSLRWVYGDGRSSRLYINGFSDLGSYSFQVVILNENSESRIVKLVLPLDEACQAMEIISCSSDRTKDKQNVLALLLKSGRICMYSDSEIEHYLLQCQSKSNPPVPNHLIVKLPYGDASITVAKLYGGWSSISSSMDEDHVQLANKYSYLFSIDKKEKDGNHTNAMHFSGFTKTKALFISGHHNGAINFWDASCPVFLLILSVKQQSEDNNSSGIAITALHFDISSQILVAGDRNGLVRIISFRKEQLASENIFSFLQAKQGGNYTTQCIKLKGAILSLSINSESKHLAVGTDKGFVSIVDMEGTTILYQKQFPSQLYSGVISLQFENCNHSGYDKNILLVGMEDSSIFTIEEDTGTTLNDSAVHTKKPSRALLMHILDASVEGVCTPESQDVSKENYIKETMPKLSLLLLSSENAVRLYSLNHVTQGVKKQQAKKKLSGTCCYASIVYGPSSGVGLLLVFTSGKIEIRSLPELTLINETSLRGFMQSALGSCPNSCGALCASSEGEVFMVNGDQEISFFSVLFYKSIYRHLEHISQVYKKDIAPQEGTSHLLNSHKEKKKGLFGMVVKDIMGNKTKQGEVISEDSSVNTAAELSAIFSTANFPSDAGSKNKSVKNEEDQLDIDDIDLEETDQKPKERYFPVVNKQKIGKTLQAIKGKLKPKTDEKVNSGKDNHEDEKVVGAIDQIKKKYGYAVNNETSTTKLAVNKLGENMRKLQGINDRTSDMENTAQSFSSMAKELLRTAQREKGSS